MKSHGSECGLKQLCCWRHRPPPLQWGSFQVNHLNVSHYPVCALMRQVKVSWGCGCPRCGMCLWSTLHLDHSLRCFHELLPWPCDLKCITVNSHCGPVGHDGPHADSHFGWLDSPGCRLGERLSAAPLRGRLIPRTPDQLLESWRVFMNHKDVHLTSDSRDHYEPADSFHKCIILMCKYVCKCV